MIGVVEFHGFKDNNNKFILKEFVVLSKSFNTQIIFKSPYSHTLLNNKSLKALHWLRCHFHKIGWEDGDVTFSKPFLKCLLAQFSTVYTRGLEKAEYLKEFHSNVVDLIDAPNVPLDYECSYVCILKQHNCTDICALRSALYYYNYRNGVTA